MGCRTLSFIPFCPDPMLAPMPFSCVLAGVKCTMRKLYASTSFDEYDATATIHETGLTTFELASPEVVCNLPSALASDGYCNLNEGDEVEFDTERGQKGMQATNVKVTKAADPSVSGRSSRSSRPPKDRY
jgi:hypothetical protein